MPTFARASQTYPIGSYTIALPQTATHRYTKLELTFTRESWPDIDPVMKVTLQRTLDNGQSFQDVASFGFRGGIILGKGGVEITVQTCAFEWGTDQPGDWQLVAQVFAQLNTAITAVLS